MEQSGLWSRERTPPPLRGPLPLQKEWADRAPEHGREGE